MATLAVPKDTDTQADRCSDKNETQFIYNLSVINYNRS